MTVAEALRGRSLAVIGGSGLIGNNLLRAAAGAGADAFCIARAVPPPTMRLDGVRYLSASVLDEGAMAALPDAALAVYVAGATSNYLDDPMLTVRLATEGVDRFLRRYAASSRRLVVGSARVYGPRSASIPISEDELCTLPSPASRNVYDGAKLVSEALAALANRESQPVVVARLGNVYGEHRAPATATAFTDLLRQARRDRRIVLNGPAGSVRNYVHAADVADGLLRALLFGHGGESYNIGSADHLTTLQLAEAIAAALPGTIPIDAPNRAAPDFMVLALDKARRDLAYAPTRRAADFIPHSVHWELENHA